MPLAAFTASSEPQLDETGFDRKRLRVSRVPRFGQRAKVSHGRVTPSGDGGHIRSQEAMAMTMGGERAAIHLDGGRRALLGSSYGPFSGPRTP
jgi:hypothetical protein